MNRATEYESIQHSAIERLKRQSSVQRIYPAQDVVEDVLYYGIQLDDGTITVINSKREIFDQFPDWMAFVEQALPLDESLHPDVAILWVEQTVSISLSGTLDALTDLFRRHCIFQELRDPLLLATWTLGTYCYRAFRVFPYAHLNSADKRCGKTRILDLLRMVGFNAFARFTNPTPSSLFRTAASGVQLFDEAETFGGDQDTRRAIFGIMNAGFEKGGFVSRMERNSNGQWVPVRFEIYGPRAFAGLEKFKDTLEDRSIPIFMIRRPHWKKIERIDRMALREGKELRAQCPLAVLTHFGEIFREYEGPTYDRLRDDQQLDDRAVDLWVPLISIAQAADNEDGGTRAQQLLSLARDQGAEIREADSEGEISYKITRALFAIRQEKDEYLTPTELLDALRPHTDVQPIMNTTRLAAVLRPLGFKARHRRLSDRRGRFYHLDSDHLRDLRGSYGPPEDWDA